MPDARLVGEQIAYHRKRLGLSQVEFAGLIGRSESWVSQVERGVRAVDRLSVLQRVADALSVSVADLREADDGEGEIEERPEAFESLRLALTGHPAVGVVLAPGAPKPAGQNLDAMRKQHAAVWPMVHASQYTELAPVLTGLIAGLELTIRSDANEETVRRARELLGDIYQAASAMLAKFGETDAAWVAADRAAYLSEEVGAPLAVAASLFRMAHVFLSLGQITQAERVARDAAAALEERISAESQPETEALSLYGAFQLVLAIAAARDNQRGHAHEHLDRAREVAARLGEDRNDYGTEFGPANVAIHAVGVAVELGDAGQAIDLAAGIDVSGLFPERQARYLIDLGAAHAMRRQIGEALNCLLEAERLTPEQTRTHRVARAVARDLLQLSGLRPRPELRELAERFGVLT